METSKLLTFRMFIFQAIEQIYLPLPRDDLEDESLGEIISPSDTEVRITHNRTILYSKL
jgi:hypothetical protein